MEGHQVGYVRMEYLQRKTGLPLHVRMGKLNSTCRVLGKRACENRKVEFHMQGFEKSVHVRMEKLDFACRGLEKCACENGKVGFYMQGFEKACM